jgi:hypothetical protein
MFPRGGDIRSVKVDGAISQTKMPSGDEGDTFSIEVTMPDGVCVARISVFITNGPRVDTRHDVCSGQALDVIKY